MMDIKVSLIRNTDRQFLDSNDGEKTFDTRPIVL